MKSSEAFIERYLRTLNSFPEDIRKIVNRPGGLTESNLLELILRPQDQSVDRPRQPQDESIKAEPLVDICVEEGNLKLQQGKVAFCILAGGAGTRIGEPKAMLRLPNLGLSLLTIKLFQSVGNGPIWIVVSPSMKQIIVDHVKSQIGIDQSRVKFIEQFESYRLHPNNDLVIVDGKPELYPCGHGDLFPALVHGGVLNEFRQNGGEHVFVVNVDNVLGGLDPMLVGWHSLSHSNVSCEVVARLSGDSGGFICVDRNQVQVVEGYRVRGVDVAQFRWLNTNSFIFKADLNIEPLGNSWNRVQKNVNGRLVIQHERLLQEITEAYDTTFVSVNREERFFPIKNLEDLKTASEKLNANSLS